METPAIKAKTITLEEKKKRVSSILDHMSKTLGIRLGNDNMIKLTRQALLKYKK